MPLPGLNPVEAAPPADSTQRVATQNQTARLHQRIADLNRQVKVLENQVGSGQWATLNMTYGTGVQAHTGAGHQPKYYKQGKLVVLAGLISITASVSAATHLATLPEEVRLAPTPLAETYFPVAWSSGSATGIYMYPADNTTIPGQIRSPFSFVAGNWISLAGIVYPVL